MRNENDPDPYISCDETPHTDSLECDETPHTDSLECDETPHTDSLECDETPHTDSLECDEKIFDCLSVDVWSIVNSYIDFSDNSVNMACSLIFKRGLSKTTEVTFTYDGENISSNILKSINDKTLFTDLLFYIWDTQNYPEACNFILMHFGEFYVTLYASKIKFNPTVDKGKWLAESVKKIKKMTAESQKQVAKELLRTPRNRNRRNLNYRIRY
jgi:hypothetical protein